MRARSAAAVRVNTGPGSVNSRSSTAATSATSRDVDDHDLIGGLQLCQRARSARAPGTSSTTARVIEARMCSLSGGVTARRR